MKKLFLLSLFAGVTVVLTGCGETDVVDYNDKFVSLTEKCFTAEGLMRSAIEQKEWDTAKTSYSRAIETCKVSHTDAVAMKAYQNDTSLKDAVVALLQAEVTYLEKFEETITYRDYEELTEDQEPAYTAIENELATIQQVINTASEELLTVQETFAAKHGYELQE